MLLNDRLLNVILVFLLMQHTLCNGEGGELVEWRMYKKQALVGGSSRE